MGLRPKPARIPRPPLGSAPDPAGPQTVQEGVWGRKPQRGLEQTPSGGLGAEPPAILTAKPPWGLWRIPKRRGPLAIFWLRHC